MNDTPSKSLKTEVGGLDLNLDYLSSIGNITGIALFWLFCIEVSGKYTTNMMNYSYSLGIYKWLLSIWPRFEIEDWLTTLFIPQLKIQTVTRAPRFSVSLCRCLHFTGKPGYVKYHAIIAKEWKSYVVTSTRWHCVLSGLKKRRTAWNVHSEAMKGRGFFALSCYETHISL